MMLLQLLLLFFFKPKLSDGKVFDACKLYSIFEDHFEKNQINDCMYNLYNIITPLPNQDLCIQNEQAKGGLCLFD